MMKFSKFYTLPSQRTHPSSDSKSTTRPNHPQLQSNAGLFNSARLLAIGNRATEMEVNSAAIALKSTIGRT